MTDGHTGSSASSSDSVFARVMCGVDGSCESLEAVRQADMLVEDGGALTLVTAVDPMQAIHFQVTLTAIRAARHALDELVKLDRAALQILAWAREEAAHAQDVRTMEVDGPPAARFVETIASEHATLAVVGTHGHGRTAGVVLGSVATRSIEHAPCSVLVARSGDRSPWAPRNIVGSLPTGHSRADARCVPRRSSNLDSPPSFIS